MAGTQVTLTLGGDATQLQRAANQASDAISSVADSARAGSQQMDRAGEASVDYGAKMGQLGSAVDGATTAIDSVGGSLQALADIQSMGATRAAELARKYAAVEQASIDLEYADRDLEDAILGVNQASIDGRTAMTDEKRAKNDAQRATMDIAAAQLELNKAIRDHGKSSAEAKVAQLDLTDAQLDLEEANIAVSQAQEDGNVAVADGKRFAVDAKQAVRDQKDAQLDLNDAQREANPPDLQKWADQLGMLTPLLTAAVGVVGLVTAAQWAWNAAQAASPTTWIVIGIIALIAVIVLIATKTTWFQDIWKAAWGWIKDTAAAVGVWFRDVLWGVYIKGTWEGIVAGVLWLKDMVVLQFTTLWKAIQQVGGWFTSIVDGIKSTFSKVTSFIVAPFKAAFNMVSDAWNNTVGKLSWTVPGWVPLVGGNSISAPKLPKFHQGGTVPGSMGQEVLAVLQAGETVSRTGSGSWDNVNVTVELVGDGLLRVIAAEVDRRGGDSGRVLGTTRG